MPVASAAPMKTQLASARGRPPASTGARRRRPQQQRRLASERRASGAVPARARQPRGFFIEVSPGRQRAVPAAGGSARPCPCMKRVKNSKRTRRVVWIDTTIASSTITSTLPTTSTSAFATTLSGGVHQRDDGRRQAGVGQREGADAGERERVDEDLQRLLDRLADGGEGGRRRSSTA